jgi:hypothetical protein
MYNSFSLNINDENVEQQVSQEYADKLYHDMQPAASFVSIPQSPVDINRRKGVFRTFTTPEISA